MSGEAESPRAREAQRTYDDYYKEFAGQKKRRQFEQTEYLSRHGDIVHALHEWRNGTARSDERLVKNAYIDLGVERSGVLTEVYEVKTGSDRQALHAAIGQLLVHSLVSPKGGTCRRFVVLPFRSELPDDISRALKSANISLMRFQLHGQAVRILGSRC